jgi:hypothetical protein
MRKKIFLIALFGALILLGCQNQGPKAGTNAEAIEAPEDITKLAEEAYLYGLQQVIFYGQRWIYTQDDSPENDSYVGVNRLYHLRKKITPDFPVVTPNATTLYGTGFLDLSEEPVIVEIPEITDRYFSFQVMDQYGIFYMMVGNQFNGTKAKSYLMVPVGYTGNLPAEFATTEVINAPSNISYANIRIGVKTGADAEIKEINGYQDKVTVTPLSKWIANGRKGVLKKDQKVVKGDYKIYEPLTKNARKQVDTQTAENFFTILSLALNDPTMTLIKDSKKEADMLNQLATINIAKGKNFQWSELDKTTQDALSKGFKNGYDKVKKTFSSTLLSMNGWMVVQNTGGYETDWLSRSVMADAGWAGPDKNISHGAAFLFVDSEGNKLNGENRYTITFDMNDLPPVTQFWSIPIYTLEGYFVHNDIERYTINSFMLDQGLLHVEDGKLIIYLQKDKPSDPKQLKNWLPSPEQGFRFAARFYGPKLPLVDGSYNMPRPVLTK